ncbi:FIG001590: Putative conserved exported protein precursor [hydrothermal vent metagenome]|uniref:FIG001590: Putative conserved exported protein n=1 Tax=hydrothermal vent metagenome TaxID=652676 RepID=A0A3B1BHW1_9ZZZZ
MLQGNYARISLCNIERTKQWVNGSVGCYYCDPELILGKDLYMPDFESLENQFDAANIILGPAEAQGLLCGLLCHSGGDMRARWISELLDGKAMQEFHDSLSELYAETSAGLQDQDFGFRPLLPDDERPMSERGRGLCDWCQGFLYGLGLSGKNMEKALSELGREGLKDLTEVTRLNIDTMEAGEENEQAILELAEFLRVAVLTIYGELTEQREQVQ